MRRRPGILLVGLLVPLAASVPARAGYTLFESGQVRPLALSPDGTRLFAVDTPDDRLEVFAVGAGGLTLLASVPVGLEPVAVAARTNTEVWVVNHLSDSVSIVDVGASPPRVTRTLLVGDEPRDIVFAGPLASGFRTRAFITTAHRGQNSPVDPQLTHEGVGRADVFVFDATNLGTTLAGTPLTVVTLFGDTPRALAVSPGGGTVYAAVFESGNRTTAIHEGAVCNGGASAAPCTVGGAAIPGGLPAPNVNVENVTGPETGLIVKFNPADNRWEDQLGRNWSPAVKFSLPDRDVFAIDANATPPAETGNWTSVGTVLFNMAVNPVSGRVYVSNTEARNEVRFEGPGGGGSTVRGHLHEARISVLDGATVNPRRLNKHINYGIVPSPAGVKDASLAIPTGMAVSSDGATLYLAAFGSRAVGVFSTAQLENDSFVPNAADHILLTGGGPSGLVLDEPRGRLYVLTRFDDAISIVDTATRTEIDHLALHTPEPPSVVAGRPFLYDAYYTSSNGEASCASCHVFGDFDSLGWDLGNPDDIVRPDNNPFRVGDPINMAFNGFHPLKGPMTTQTLRGMAHDGPMHWRGDRTGSASPGGDALDEDAAFNAFNVAFSGLLGRSGPLTDAEMQAFTDFILQVTMPPNPIRNLDNSLTSDQAAGRSFFMFSSPSDVFQTCNGCHVDDAATQFGTDGFSSFEFERQNFKIPQLRNLYQKVGMFGMLAVPFFNTGDNGNKGNQVRGFGFLHDGSVDTIFRFHNATVFNQTNPGGLPVPNPGGFLNGSAGDPLRRQVEQFILAFDSDLRPIVGQQVTLTDTNAAAVDARLTLIVSAGFSDCDVVVKGTVAGEQRGWVFLGGPGFRSDRADEPLIDLTTLRALAATPGQALTFTCAPRGSGFRIGVDRDEDGFFDRDELDLGTDPADPASVPAGTTTTTVAVSTTTTTSLPPLRLIRGHLVLGDDDVAPILPTKRKIVFTANTTRDTGTNTILSPSPFDPSNDPRVQGATLVVYNSDPTPGSPTDTVTIPLPAANWTLSTSAFRQYVYTDSSPTAPISSVKLQPLRLKVKGKGLGWPYTLDEAAQGRVAVRFTIGGTSGFYAFCADLPAKASGSPPSTAHNDHQDRFIGDLKSPSTSCATPKN